MSIAFQNALGLFALGALLVPVLLHLARRSEHRAIDFAAVRWLSAHARPRRRVLLVEPLLLMLRVLMLAALVLLLAEPVWTAGARNQVWTVIAPGVNADSIPPEEDERHERRWLAPGFPPVDGPGPTMTAPVASLLRELDGRLPSSVSLTVWVPRELAGLDGSRIGLSRPVQWRVAPAGISRAATHNVSPAPFAVRVDQDRESVLPYLRAAWQAWLRDSSAVADRSDATARQLADVAGSSRTPRDSGSALVWLRSGDLPPEVRQWVVGGGTILIEPRTNWRFRATPVAVVWRDEAGMPLARAARFGRGRVVRLEVPLDASALPGLHEGSFAAALREMLSPRDVPRARALARDVVPVLDRKIGRTGVSLQRDLDLESWLAWLIATAFVVERLVATASRRWRSA